LADTPPDFTPVTLITGFLGSGKTTLLQRLLLDPALSDTAVLINEFGEIGLDHHLLERIDEAMVMLQSGCVCCTIRGELSTAIKDLHSRRERGLLPPFRRLVVESTGLADPFPILSTVRSDPVLRLPTMFTRARVQAKLDYFRRGNARSATLHAHRGGKVMVRLLSVNPNSPYQAPGTARSGRNPGVQGGRANRRGGDPSLACRSPKTGNGRSLRAIAAPPGHAWVSRVASSAPPVLLLPQHAGAAQRAKGGRMRFHDKVALITAAASGIGRATADIIARRAASSSRSTTTKSGSTGRWRS
jgi:hypothetical protein